MALAVQVSCIQSITPISLAAETTREILLYNEFDPF